MHIHELSIFSQLHQTIIGCVSDVKEGGIGKLTTEIQCNGSEFNEMGSEEFEIKSNKLCVEHSNGQL